MSNTTKVFEVSKVEKNEEGAISFMGTRYDYEASGGIKVQSFGKQVVLADSPDFVNNPDFTLEENVFEYAKTLILPDVVDLVTLTKEQTVGDPNSGIAEVDAVQPAILSYDVCDTDPGVSGIVGADEVKESEKGEIPGSTEVSERTFEGKKILSDGYRKVNEKTYHHIKLEDGSTYDLTEEQYTEKVLGIAKVA